MNSICIFKTNLLLVCFFIFFQSFHLNAQTAGRKPETNEKTEKTEDECQCEDVAFNIQITKLAEDGSLTNQSQTLNYDVDFDAESPSKTVENFEVSSGDILLAKITNLQFNCTCSGSNTDGCNNLAGRRLNGIFLDRGKPSINLGSASGTNDNQHCSATSRTRRMGRTAHNLGWNNNNSEYAFLMAINDERTSNNTVLYAPYQYIQISGYCYNEDCGEPTSCHQRVKIVLNWKN